MGGLVFRNRLDTDSTTDPVAAARLPSGGTWEGLVGVEGGIPNRTTQSGSTIAPYTGSPATINDALDNCPADQFVLLGAGTFHISGNIYNDGNRRTLRGAVDGNGQPATTIDFTTDASVILGDINWDFGTSNQWSTLNITAGVSRGSTTITMASSPSALAVNQVFWISAPASATVAGGNTWAVWFGPHPWSQACRCLSKSGNTITFEPPISADYLTGTLRINFRSENMTKLSGIENISFVRDGGASANTAHYIRMNGVDNCWLKNVKTYFTAGGGIHHCWLSLGYRCEIRHCEMSHTVTGGGSSSNAYCILNTVSSGWLIEDNYFHDIPNVMPMFSSGLGAFAYNYITDLPYPASPAWLSQIVFFHGGHSHYNLFEGNWCAASYNDGAGDQDTDSRNNLWFRNRMRGWDATPSPNGKTDNCQAVTTNDHATNFVIAGNVLGESGFHTKYNWGTLGDRAIYAIDPADDGTCARLANYNTVDSGIRAAEALSAGQALVTSYLHAAKPSWFSSLPWPWVSSTNYTQSNTSANVPAGYRAAHGVDP